MDGLLSMTIYDDLLWTICFGRFTGNNQYLTLDLMTPDDTSILKFETLRVAEKCDMVSLMPKVSKRIWLQMCGNLESQHNCWSLQCGATLVGEIWPLYKSSSGRRSIRKPRVLWHLVYTRSKDTAQLSPCEGFAVQSPGRWAQMNCQNHNLEFQDMVCVCVHIITLYNIVLYIWLYIQVQTQRLWIQCIQEDPCEHVLGKLQSVYRIYTVQYCVYIYIQYISIHTWVYIYIINISVIISVSVWRFQDHQLPSTHPINIHQSCWVRHGASFFSWPRSVPGAVWA